jgi:hypothetical protein
MGKRRPAGRDLGRDPNLDRIRALYGDEAVDRPTAPATTA